MILNIDTSDNEYIKLSLEGGAIIKSKKIKAHRKQSEKLLVSIGSLLSSVNCSLRDLRLIRVANKGGSFTALRVGVLTANALAYSLGVKVEALDINERGNKKFNKNFNIVIPKYNRDAI